MNKLEKMLLTEAIIGIALGVTGATINNKYLEYAGIVVLGGSVGYAIAKPSDVFYKDKTDKEN